MKTYTLSILADDEEEMVASILDSLRKRNVIRFAAGQPVMSAPPASAAELESRVLAADAQPRLSFAEARQRLGL